MDSLIYTETKESGEASAELNRNEEDETENLKKPEAQKNKKEEISISQETEIISETSTIQETETVLETASTDETSQLLAEESQSVDETTETQEIISRSDESSFSSPNAYVAEADPTYSDQQGMKIDPKTGKDQYLTDPVPEGKPLPVEWQGVTIDTDTKLSCTLAVSCRTILNNMDIFNPDKLEVLPEDGIIFPPKQVTFYKGESVFNVLQREMKKNKIHMEFVMTPMYNSVYIEGIHNIYEFDAGELSGWMYKVNNWFPNYGCSRYALKDGDVIEWEYTCDLGRDIGGYYSMGGMDDLPEDKKKVLQERIYQEEQEKQNNDVEEYDHQ